MTGKKKRGPNLWILFGGLLLLAPVVLLFAKSFGNDPKAVPNILEGTAAPTFTLIDLDGQPFDLAAHRGEPIMLNFWSSWCGPCKQEHPYLLQAPSLYPNVTFVGVLYSDTADKARRFLRQSAKRYPKLVDPSGVAYPHLVDETGRVAIDYGVAGVPETYFISPDGQIMHKEIGPIYPALLQKYLGQYR